MMKNQCISFALIFLATTTYATEFQDKCFKSHGVTADTVVLLVAAIPSMLKLTQNQIEVGNHQKQIEKVSDCLNTEENDNDGEDSSVLCINRPSFFAPSDLGEVKLFYDADGFHVVHNGIRHDVANYWLEKPLRNITRECLEAFLEYGYIIVSQLDSGEFTLKTKVRGFGGGAIGYSIGYYGAKALGYGIPITLTATAAVAVVPVVSGAGLAAGVSTAAANSIAVAGGVMVESAVGGGLAVTAGTAIAAPTVIATMGATAATDAVVAVATASASSGGYITFVESAALVAGWALGIILPF